MSKVKIYLDTSAISHLEPPEKPSEQSHSHEMFNLIRRGLYSAYLSRVVFDEIAGCQPAKREMLLKYISDIDFIEIPITETVLSLAKKIIDQNVLPTKSIMDSQHIAAAIVAGCDYIVSWNMKHMANIRINKGVRHITIDEGHKEIMLLPPSMLLDGGHFYES